VDHDPYKVALYVNYRCYNEESGVNSSAGDGFARDVSSGSKHAQQAHSCDGRSDILPLLGVSRYVSTRVENAAERPRCAGRSGISWILQPGNNRSYEHHRDGLEGVLVSPLGAVKDVGVFVGLGDRRVGVQLGVLDLRLLPPPSNDDGLTNQYEDG